MGLRNLFATPPFKTPILSTGGTINQSWLVFLNALARLGKVLIVDAATDPPSMASGAGVTVAVACPGARPGDFASASFSAAPVGILLAAQVTAADVVTAMFLNLTASPVDLPSGTLRVRVEMQA